MLALENLLSELRPGKVIGIGMREGRNAVYLAQKRALRSTALMPRASLLIALRKLAQEKGVTVEAKVQNLDFFLMPLMKSEQCRDGFFPRAPTAVLLREARRGLVAGGTSWDISVGGLRDGTRARPPKRWN
jgi:hypothetical protein